MTAAKDDDDGAVSSGRRDRRAGNMLTDSLAALLSSSLFTTTFYPLHRIKILLQTQDSNPLVTSGQVRRYTVVGVLPRLLREGGLRELWRGNGAYMLRHVPSTTLSFVFKDALLRHVLPHVDMSEGGTGGEGGEGRAGTRRLAAAAAVNLTAGFLGGAAALLLVYPLDFATIRMAAELRQHKKSAGLMDTINSTQRTGGLAALYRGYGVSALAIGAYKALYFGLYDTAVAAMEQRNARRAAAAVTAAAGGGGADGDRRALVQAPPPAVLAPSLMERWAAANVVVFTASSITYPLDVVRKRLVADTALGPARQQYRGFADCVSKIAKTEGMRGFYRFYGYDMLLRLGGGVLLVLYDELKAHGATSLVRQMLRLPPPVALLPAAEQRNH